MSSLGTYTVEGEDKRGKMDLLWVDHCPIDNAIAAMDAYETHTGFSYIVLSRWRGRESVELIRRCTFQDICLPNC